MESDRTPQEDAQNLSFTVRNEQSMGRQVDWIAGLKALGGVEGPSAGQRQKHRSLLLIIARYLSYLESQTVSSVLELLANTFPGQGNSGGSDQPPAFVAAEIARSACTHSPVAFMDPPFSCCICERYRISHGLYAPECKH